MSKFIAGILLGVVATATVFYLIDGTPPETQELSTGQSESIDNKAAVEQANSAVQNNGASKEDSEGPTNSLPREPVSNAEPVALQATPTVTPPPDATAPRSPQTSRAKTTNNNYPPEIAEMLANSKDKELQAKYESDEREESWATYMEGQLTAYFAQKPELSQFNFSLIDCRTSLCEIHALGYGPDAITQWNIATADIVSQPWHDFQSMSMNRQNPQPDILGIVLILNRKAE